VLLSGANGTGKSTLLAALAGDIPLQSGSRRAAAGAVIAQLGQDRTAFEPPSDPSPPRFAR
jgi:ATPase subunit of ABC transporter with duplicated ATPase domains